LFVTMLLVVIAPWTRSIAYANAGHVPGLLVDARGGLAARLIGSGPPLGLGEGRQYRLGTAGPMASGDVLVLVTDGATECPNQADEPFDEAGVFEAVRANQDASAEEIVASLRDRLRAYGGGRHDSDDVTLVIVKASAG
jgi:sigma-B regulation protein RsbU (phosphoserine phosphatase)